MGYVLRPYSRIYNKMNDRGRTCDHLSLIEFFINDNKQVRGITLTFAYRPLTKDQRTNKYTRID